jgi:hypothetical protein
MKKARLAIFNSIFLKLEAVKSARRKDFEKVFGVLAEFARQKLGKEIYDLNFFGELVVAGGEVNPALISFVEKYYENDSTRVSQLNRLENLILAELGLSLSAATVTPELASVGLIDPAKIPAHLKGIWLALPRVKGRSAESDEEREKLPLTLVSSEVFKGMLSISDQYGVDDEMTLLGELKDVVASFIKNNIHHKLRRRAQECFLKVRRRYGLKHQASGFTEADLPPQIRECLRVFRLRAPHGFLPYPELKAQMEKYKGRKGLRDGALGGSSIKRYVEAFVYGISRLDLAEDTCLQDLLVLDSRPIEYKGIVVGTVYFNRLIEPYAAAERARSKDDWKASNVDSIPYIHFLDALFSIARYNGEFNLPAEFRKRVEVRRDKRTLRDRQRKKKHRFPREWVDAEILRLKSEFDRAISKKTFVDDKRHLRICLFLPQLVVMRYLGYRQQCLRRCLIGRNIKFGKDGSVSFYYARDEIKNKVVIDQTFDADSCSEIPELLLMLDVLTSYYRVFLPTVRALSPDDWEERMGRMFFAVPARGKTGLIQRAPVDEKSPSTQEAEGDDGSRHFFYWFTEMAYGLMNFDGMVDFPHEFNPHLLRGHCCDWLRKDKGWSWEDVAKAMGDREETLKREYYEEDEREQSSSPYVKYNNKLRAEREQRERIANSVPLEALNKMQAALGNVSDQLSEERELRKRAEDEARTYRRNYEFVLSMANITDGEVRSRLMGEPAYA